MDESHGSADNGEWPFAGRSSRRILTTIVEWCWPMGAFAAA
jgi:hypothetical protein